MLKTSILEKWIEHDINLNTNFLEEIFTKYLKHKHLIKYTININWISLEKWEKKYNKKNHKILVCKI